MREIIDEKGQFYLDLEGDKKNDNTQPNKDENNKSLGETDKKGREIPHCPRCGGILHAGAPCEK